MPEEIWTEVRDTVQEERIKTIPKKNKYKKAKWLSEEALQIAVNRREKMKSLSCVQLFATPWTEERTRLRLFRPWDFPGKNPGVGCHFLLQDIFLTRATQGPSLMLGTIRGQSSWSRFQSNFLKTPPLQWWSQSKRNQPWGLWWLLAGLIIGRCGLRADPDNRVQMGCLDFTITPVSHKCFLQWETLGIHS